MSIIVRLEDFLGFTWAPSLSHVIHPLPQLKLLSPKYCTYHRLLSAADNRWKDTLSERCCKLSSLLEELGHSQECSLTAYLETQFFSRSLWRAVFIFLRGGPMWSQTFFASLFLRFWNRQQRGLQKAELLSYIFRSLLSLFNCIEDLNWRRLFKTILLLSSHWLMMISLADETSSLFYKSLYELELIISLKFCVLHSPLLCRLDIAWTPFSCMLHTGQG